MQKEMDKKRMIGQTKKTPTKYQLPRLHRKQFSTRAVGGWVVPVAESCHFVVQLARLQDFKQCLNSQVGPKCGKNAKNAPSDTYRVSFRKYFLPSGCGVGW